jgi:hypothetical protein
MQQYGCAALEMELQRQVSRHGVKSVTQHKF